MCSGAAAPIIFFITLGGILGLRTFPRPGSSEALSIDPGAAARDSRAAAIDRRRDLLDMSNLVCMTCGFAVGRGEVRAILV